MVTMSWEKAWKEQTLSRLLLDQQLLGSIASHSQGDHKQAKWYLKTVGETHLHRWESRESTLSLNKLLIECVRTQILTHRREINMGLTLTKGTCEEGALLGLPTAQPVRGYRTLESRISSTVQAWWRTWCGLGAGWLWLDHTLTLYSPGAKDGFYVVSWFFKKSKDERYFMARGHYMKCDLSCTSGKSYLNTATLKCLLTVCGSCCNSKTVLTENMARKAARVSHLAFTDKFADPGLVRYFFFSNSGSQPTSQSWINLVEHDDQHSRWKKKKWQKISEYIICCKAVFLLKDFFFF